MRSVFDSIACTMLALAAGATGAQPVATASAPAASAPMTAASRAVPARNPAVVAAENAKEPGVQRPEERVVPQLVVPLKSRSISAAAAASAPVGLPGAINDGAARCMALRSAAEKAACERGLPASAPVKPAR